MLGLRRFIDQLQKPEEQPIEPELKTTANKERDKEIKEQQDLRSGAVLQAVSREGEGSSTPNEGDLVYVHFNVLDAENNLLHTTWAEEGGSGQPVAFVLGKGCRAPRAWELALTNMTRQMRKQLKVQPSYGYRHPDCSMAPPPGVPVDQVLQFSLQLVSWYPAKQVRVLGDEANIFKHLITDSSKWEVARPPNEVVFSLKLSLPGGDKASGGGGQPLLSSSSQSPYKVQLGGGLLPLGLESALCSMSKGEKCVFVIPAAAMQTQQPTSSSREQECVSIPPLPDKCVQVEAEVELLELVQVRDVTGDGRVMKKRLREGQGEFPVDCPLHDTTVRLHYRVRSLAGGTPGPWVYDTRTQGHTPHANGTTSSSSQAAEQHSSSSSSGNSSSDGGSSPAGAAPPVEVDTGCGDLPEGLELVVKLMVPGETAAATCAPHYAYQRYSDPPPVGISPSDPVEFEAQLVSFDREGFWQHMDWAARWALADRLKDKGNALFKAKKYQFAVNKYTHLLRLIESTRDYEEQEQVDKADGYKAALLSNLALAAFYLEEYARSIEWCDKALQAEPSNAKAVFRKGKALSMKGDYEEADQYLAAAAEMDAGLVAEVEAARAANKQREKAASSKQKQQFRNFFAKS